MMTTRQRSATPASQTAVERERLPAELSQVNLNAAGIDVGASSHFVAVSADRAEPPVREFAAFTADLYRIGGLAGRVRGEDRGHGVDRRVQAYPCSGCWKSVGSR